MRTTVELPDELLARARREAAGAGITLKQMLVEALEDRLAGRKVRRPPPTVGRDRGARLRVLTAEQIDEAMFG